MIRFRRPGRGTLHARFVLDPGTLDEIRRETERGGSVDRVLSVMMAAPAHVASAAMRGILGFEGDTPVLLRPGGLPVEAIAEALGREVAAPARPGISAPGQLASHYAPSAPLRRWFGHDPARFAEFRQRYIHELSAQEDKLQALRRRAREKTVTLVYGARDTEHNDAVVLAELLRAETLATNGDEKDR